MVNLVISSLDGDIDLKVPSCIHRRAHDTTTTMEEKTSFPFNMAQKIDTYNTAGLFCDGLPSTILPLFLVGPSRA